MAMATVMAVDNRGHDFVRWDDVPHGVVTITSTPARPPLAGCSSGG
jgi:hypothetical protein